MPQMTPEKVREISENVIAEWEEAHEIMPKLRDRFSAALLSVARERDAEAIEKYIEDHGITCDCCQHVMIDVTAAKDPTQKQHCVAGDPEGEGCACAHGMLADHEAKLRERDREIAMLRGDESAVHQGALAALSAVKQMGTLKRRAEAAEARCKALEQEVERLREELRLSQVQYGIVTKRAESAEARVKALEDALNCPHCDNRGCPDCTTAAMRARAVLNPASAESGEERV